MSDREILAQHSYQELVDLSIFFKKYGPYPIVIGGWAVFIYNQYLGSVDIDIVGPSMGGMFNNLLTQFQISNGYTEMQIDKVGIEKGFKKTIYDGEKIIGEMEVDACSYEGGMQHFHENPDKILPYNLCSRDLFTNKFTLTNGAEIILPKKSLLILYKIKALRDRSYDLEKGYLLSAGRRSWLESKILKDASDIIALLDPNPTFLLYEQADPIIIKDIIAEFDISFILDSFEKLSSMADSLRLYKNISKDTVDQWVTKLINF